MDLPLHASFGSAGPWRGARLLGDGEPQVPPGGSALPVPPSLRRWTLRLWLRVKALLAGRALHPWVVGAHVRASVGTRAGDGSPTSFAAVLVVSFGFPLAFRGARGMESMVLSGQLIHLLALLLLEGKSCLCV